jgi:F0F1-type ATP synthase membrane subunit b/b'
MNIELETTFKQLAAQFVEKQADLRALETQRRASGQRLDDAVKREAEAQTALRKVTEQLESARKELSNAGRSAKQLISDSQARAEQIIAAAHDQAQKYLADVYTAVAALIEQHKEETE